MLRGLPAWSAHCRTPGWSRVANTWDLVGSEAPVAPRVGGSLRARLQSEHAWQTPRWEGCSMRAGGRLHLPSSAAGRGSCLSRGGLRAGLSASLSPRSSATSEFTIRKGPATALPGQLGASSPANGHPSFPMVDLLLSLDPELLCAPRSLSSAQVARRPLGRRG